MERAAATGESGKGPSWNTQNYAGGKGGKDANRGGKSTWQRGNGNVGGMLEQRMLAKSTSGHAGLAAEHAASCPKGGK